MKLEDFTFKGRMMKKLKMLSLSDKEFQRMRKMLMTDGKEIFFLQLKKLQKIEKDDWFYKTVMDYYDERINTLPKESLYDLYLSYEAIENSTDKDFDTLLFCNHAQLTYSLNGWFRKKLAKLMIQKSTSL
jgi:hypothetical protein